MNETYIDNYIKLKIKQRSKENFKKTCKNSIDFQIDQIKQRFDNFTWETKISKKFALVRQFDREKKIFRKTWDDDSTI